MDLFVRGPVGRLEAILELPEDEPRAAAIVCHPHPAHGGTMHNTVVFRTARGLREAGLVTLRFNFRGVEASEGEYDGDGGEVEDARAALDYLAERFTDVELWGAGFSFGSRTISLLAQSDARIERVLLIALPTRAYPCEGVETIRQPTFLQFASEDEFGNRADFERRVPDVPAHFTVDQIEGTDHFFRRRTPILQENVRSYARSALS